MILLSDVFISRDNCKQFFLMSSFFKFMRMNKYLKEVKTLVKGLKKQPVLVVIGNESVDLDSAVSSICLAYHLNKVKCNSSVIPASQQAVQFLAVPVINAPRLDLPLKTEVTHWLQKHHIELDNLLCRDEINLSDNVDSFVLVDHHVSEFRAKVISVLDHRPFDSISNLSSDCFISIQEVASCATLVADVIRSDENPAVCSEDYSEALKLCYGAIVLDSINFSEKADKVRPLDVKTSEFIETLLNIEDVPNARKSLFEDLVAARANVASLDSLQILSKDLKTISNENGKVKVAIPGVDVFKYIEMENAANSVKIFSERSGIDVVVLMGMAPKGDSVERFIGVINIKNETLFNGVSLMNSIKVKDNFYPNFYAFLRWLRR